MTKPLINIKNMYKIYQMGSEKVHALDGVDIEIYEHEFVAIIGASGSGKSTLMNMIGILDTPTSGKYLFNNVNVANFEPDTQADFRRDKIGFVFQWYNLLPRLEAWKQVALPLFYKGRGYEKRYKRAVEVLTQLWLKERLNHSPDMLSWGEQQRVCIGRALACNPDLILSDEPTGALDSKTGEDLLKLFTDLNKQGITMIMVTHDPEVASYAKKTIHIKDGLIHKIEKQ